MGRPASPLPALLRAFHGHKALGASDTATNMLKYIERQEWKEKRAAQVRNGAGALLAAC